MISRRDLLKHAGQLYVGTRIAPLTHALAAPGVAPGGLRCVNVVNFIREIEPRFKMDMMLPVREQMNLLREHRLPATWLLQFDALVSGPFVPFLKERMGKDHEVGFWFEMNERHCKAAGVEWRGRPGYEWDHLPFVAFTIGYTEAERIKLADTAMAEFRRVWGRYPKSVASWNLDAITMTHLSDRYGIDAYAVCRDQIATDGFTIWGAPIAGYYPSKTNCWSPALQRSHQISTPVFRMLGQDPVYYYYREWRDAHGQRVTGPDTMEPVWPTGRSERFVREFVRMIEEAPTLGFAYAQIGQENTFPWDQQAAGYPPQMKALVELRERGAVHLETMGESGRRFKRAFRETPAQAQVQLADPFGNTDPAQASVWYQSRFYRANLHLKGDLPFLRDLTVYSDRSKQPFLDAPTRDHDVEQRMPAVLDGYHWSPNPGSPTEEGAGGYFTVGDRRLRLTGKPRVREESASLLVDLPVDGGRTLQIRFDERTLTATLSPKSEDRLALAFEWDPAKAALVDVQPNRARYRWQGLDYAVKVEEGAAGRTDRGWTIERGRRGIRLAVAQEA
jgi:hypothetical protein